MVLFVPLLSLVSVVFLGTGGMSYLHGLMSNSPHRIVNKCQVNQTEKNKYLSTYVPGFITDPDLCANFIHITSPKSFSAFVLNLQVTDKEAGTKAD